MKKRNIVKKLTAAALALVMALSLAACSGGRRAGTTARLSWRTSRFF